jgi:hypothetical protein
VKGVHFASCYDSILITENTERGGGVLDGYVYLGKGTSYMSLGLEVSSPSSSSVR